MIRGASLSLLALIASLSGGALTVSSSRNQKGTGRYAWDRNSFFEARRQGRRRAAMNRRKAARS